MERASRRLVRHVDCLDAAVALLAPAFAKARDERLHVAHLDKEQALVGLRIRFAAKSDLVDLPIKTIVADALALGSTQLIIAHNHPSGDPTPSANDIEATRRLVQATRPIGVHVRDHLVFAGPDYVSFRQRGLL